MSTIPAVNVALGLCNDLIGGASLTWRYHHQVRAGAHRLLPPPLRMELFCHLHSTALLHHALDFPIHTHPSTLTPPLPKSNPTQTHRCPTTSTPMTTRWTRTSAPSTRCCASTRGCRGAGGPFGGHFGGPVGAGRGAPPRVGRPLSAPASRPVVAIRAHDPCDPKTHPPSPLSPLLPPKTNKQGGTATSTSTCGSRTRPSTWPSSWGTSPR
jgi:hypothetical protein